MENIKKTELKNQTSENKKPDKVLSAVTGIYIMLMCSVYLLFAGSGGYENITESKYYMFTALSVGYIVVWFLMMAELRIVGEAEPGGFKRLVRRMSVPAWMLLAYAAVTLVSAVFSEFYETAVWGGVRREGAVTIVLYSLCAVLISVTYKPSRKHLVVFAAAMSIECIIAFVQIAGYNPFALYPEGMTFADAFVKYTGSFLGTIGNIDQMSALLCVAIPVFMTGMIRLNGSYRFVLAIPLALCVVLLFLQDVQGGILGVFLGIVLSLPMVCRISKKKRVVIFAVIAVLMIIFLVFIFCAGAQLSGSFYELSQIMHGDFNDSYATGRLYIWKNTLPLVPEHLLLGGGPDTLMLRIESEFGGYNEELGRVVTSKIDAAHNEYLNVLVNQGIIALLLYMAALLALARQWIKKSDERSVTAICGGAVLAYCIQAFFGISCLVSAPYLWIVIGIMISDKGTCI